MSKTDLLARLEALAGFARHTTLCGIIGGYNRCTCGLEEVEAHLSDIIAALRAGEASFVAIVGSRRQERRIDSLSELLRLINGGAALSDIRLALPTAPEDTHLRSQGGA